jgi:hypothetical protein
VWKLNPQLTLSRTPSGVWLHAAPRSACKAGARSPASPAYDSERAFARRGEPRDVSAADAASSQPGWKPHQALRSAWPAVYACMGVAAWLVWRRGGLAVQAAPLAAYLALLAASWLAWPPLFGGGHPLRRACTDALGAPPTAPSSDTAWRGSAALQWLQAVSAQMRYEGMFLKQHGVAPREDTAVCVSHACLAPARQCTLIQEAGRSLGQPGRCSGGGVPCSGPGSGAAAAALCRLDLLRDRAGQLRAGLRQRRGARHAHVCPRCCHLHWSAQQRAAAERGSLARARQCECRGAARCLRI